MCEVLLYAVNINSFSVSQDSRPHQSNRKQCKIHCLVRDWMWLLTGIQPACNEYMLNTDNTYTTSARMSTHITFKIKIILYVARALHKLCNVQACTCTDF